MRRIGFGSRVVVTGDTTQVDLPPNQQSGLVDSLEKLRGIKGIAAVELERGDIVRHRLVQNIVNAYERNPSSLPGSRRSGAPDGDS